MNGLAGKQRDIFLVPMTQITVLDGKEIKVIPTDETAPLAQKVATNAAIFLERAMRR